MSCFLPYFYYSYKILWLDFKLLPVFKASVITGRQSVEKPNIEPEILNNFTALDIGSIQQCKVG